MKKWLLLVAVCLMFLGPANSGIAQQQKVDCKLLENYFSSHVDEEDGICSVEIVRRDLNVMHMGKKMSPETMELVFHFSFENIGDQTAVMGELALQEKEINPVIDQLRKGNLEVSALHNHMIYERPRIMYVHFQGLGDIKQQAAAIKKAIEQTGFEG